MLDEFILWVSDLFCRFYSIYFDRSSCKQTLFDPDQTPHNVVSDLGLECLPTTILRVSMLE